MGDVMLLKRILIENNIGLHARPAAMLAAEANKYQSQILLRCGDVAADAKKPMRVLAMGVTKGMTVELVVAGEDENYALWKMTEVLNAINSLN